MKSTIVKAPAKVNLYLDVINKRPDGYHNLETIFERIDLCDWIRVSVIPKGIELFCSENLRIKDKDNTAYKAARLLIDKYNLKCGFRIEIYKCIPQGSGLGGGSSDAASTILGINALLKLNISKNDLSKIALKIGADVPFFVSGYQRAFATGVGEALEPLKQREKLNFLLVWPNISISTASVYGKLNLGLTKKTSNVNILAHYLKYLPLNSINNILSNKLEEVVLPSYPVLCKIKKALKQTGAEGVLVSGSGSTVFGIFSRRKEALQAGSMLAKKSDWRLFLARNY